MEKKTNEKENLIIPSISTERETAPFTTGTGWNPTTTRDNTITCEDLISIMMTPIPGFKYVIIDCRYPYEYNGGHFLDAVNIYSFPQLLAFLGTEKTIQPHELIFIFHCEFSKSRAPRIFRTFRNFDRLHNKRNRLTYPYCFILEGGFSRFWETYSKFSHFFSKDAEYIHMDDPRYKKEWCYYKKLYRSQKLSNVGLNLNMWESTAVASPLSIGNEPFLDSEEEEEEEEGPDGCQPPVDVPERSVNENEMPPPLSPSPSLSTSILTPVASYACACACALDDSSLDDSDQSSSLASDLLRLSGDSLSSYFSFSTDLSSTSLLSSDSSLDTPPSSPSLSAMDPSLSLDLEALESSLSRLSLGNPP